MPTSVAWTATTTSAHGAQRGISGGEGWCGNTTNKRVLVTHPDGSQTVEEIQDDPGSRRLRWHG